MRSSPAEVVAYCRVSSRVRDWRTPCWSRQVPAMQTVQRWTVEGRCKGGCLSAGRLANAPTAVTPIRRQIPLARTWHASAFAISSFRLQTVPQPAGSSAFCRFTAIVMLKTGRALRFHSGRRVLRSSFCSCAVLRNDLSQSRTINYEAKYTDKLQKRAQE